MQKRGKLGVRDAASQEIRAPAQAIESAPDLKGQFGEVVGAAVCQCAFGQAPHAFVGVQLRRVAGEICHPQPPAFPAQRVDRVAVMDGRIVEQQHHRPAQVAQQLTDKLADPQLIQVGLVQAKVQAQALAARTHRDGGNHRNLVAPRAMANQRRLPSRRPGLGDGGDQQEARFVGKDDVGPQPSGVFFTRGHCSRFQRSMALALRSSARRSGF